MSYILDGKFYKGEVPLHEVSKKVQSTFKSWDHDRQREDHARDILQPYNKDGSVNEEFVEQYPEESKDYGLRPKEEE